MALTGPTPLSIDENGRTVQEGYRHMQSGSVTVTTAGTPVKLANSSTEAKRIDIQNPATNNVTVYVGGTDVSSTKGIPILPNNTYTFTITDLSSVWVDASADATTVPFNYFW